MRTHEAASARRRETTLAKAGDVQRQWKIVDAEGVSLGRLASDVAVVLMGKHRPEYTPHIDTGDNVIIINANKVGLTGTKAQHKLKYHYTGYPGGLKAETFGQVRDDKPERLIEDAVKRMLPKNRLGRHMLKKMKVFPGTEHPYASHQPETMKI